MEGACQPPMPMPTPTPTPTPSPSPTPQVVAVYDGLARELGGYGRLTLGVNTGGVESGVGMLAWVCLTLLQATSFPVPTRASRLRLLADTVHVPVRSHQCKFVCLLYSACTGAHPEYCAAEPEQLRGPQLGACLEAFRRLKAKGLGGAFTWALDNSWGGGFQAEGALLRIAAEPAGPEAEPAQQQTHAAQTPQQ